jgi:hypothetical protein
VIPMLEAYAELVNTRSKEAKRNGEYINWQLHDLLMIEEGGRWRVFRMSRQGDFEKRRFLYEADNSLDAIKYLWQNTPH